MMAASQSAMDKLYNMRLSVMAQVYRDHCPPVEHEA